MNKKLLKVVGGGVPVLLVTMAISSCQPGVTSPINSSPVDDSSSLDSSSSSSSSSSTIVDPTTPKPTTPEPSTPDNPIMKDTPSARHSDFVNSVVGQKVVIQGRVTAIIGNQVYLQEENYGYLLLGPASVTVGNSYKVIGEKTGVDGLQNPVVTKLTDDIDYVVNEMTSIPTDINASKYSLYEFKDLKLVGKPQFSDDLIKVTFKFLETNIKIELAKNHVPDYVFDAVKGIIGSLGKSDTLTISKGIFNKVGDDYIISLIDANLEITRVEDPNLETLTTLLKEEVASLPDFIYGANNNLDGDNSLALVESFEIEGVTYEVTWTSSEPTIIENGGAAIYDGDTDSNKVKMNAVINYDDNEISAFKELYVKGFNEESKVTAILATINLPSDTKISLDLNAVIGDIDWEVSWISSNEAVLNNLGQVQDNIPESTDITFKLRIKSKYGYGDYEKVFNIKVLGSTMAEKIEADFKEISIPSSFDSSSPSITLPTVGTNSKLPITWSTENKNLQILEGVLSYKNGYESSNLPLIATITNGEQKVTHEYATIAESNIDYYFAKALEDVEKILSEAGDITLGKEIVLPKTIDVDGVSVSISFTGNNDRLFKITNGKLVFTNSLLLGQYEAGILTYKAKIGDFEDIVEGLKHYELDNIKVEKLMISEIGNYDANNQWISIYNGTKTDYTFKDKEELFFGWVGKYQNYVNLKDLTIKASETLIVFNPKSTIFVADDTHIPATDSKGLPLDMTGMKGIDLNFPVALGKFISGANEYYDLFGDPSKLSLESAGYPIDPANGEAMAKALPGIYTRVNTVVAPNAENLIPVDSWNYKVTGTSEVAHYAKGGYQVYPDDADIQTELLAELGKLNIPATTKKDLVLTSEISHYFATLTYESKTPSVISHAGVVTRTEADSAPVTITVTATLGSVIVSKDFTVVVEGYKEQALLDEYLGTLALAKDYHDDEELPTSVELNGGLYTITWSVLGAGMSLEVVDNKTIAKISPSDTVDQLVTLTATVNALHTAELSVTKSYAAKILKAVPQEILDEAALAAKKETIEALFVGKKAGDKVYLPALERKGLTVSYNVTNHALLSLKTELVNIEGVNFYEITILHAPEDLVSTFTLTLTMAGVTDPVTITYNVTVTNDLAYFESLVADEIKKLYVTSEQLFAGVTLGKTINVAAIPGVSTAYAVTLNSISSDDDIVSVTDNVATNSFTLKANKPKVGATYLANLTYKYLLGVKEVSVAQETLSIDNVSVNELFISEVSFASTNVSRWIVVYNGTSKAVTLGDYELNLYKDGATTAETKFFANNAEMVLEAGASVVVGYTGGPLLKGTDYKYITSTAKLAFLDANDAYRLIKKVNGTDIEDKVIDQFGIYGVNAQFKFGDDVAKQATYHRKSSVTKGFVQTEINTPDNCLNSAEWEKSTTQGDVSKSMTHEADSGYHKPYKLLTLAEKQKIAQASLDTIDIANPIAYETTKLDLASILSFYELGVTWATTDATIVAVDGTVAYKADADSSSVTLTAQIKVGEDILGTKDFVITVKGLNQRTKIEADLNAIVKQFPASVTTDIKLPTNTATDNLAITWVSSNEAVLGSDGTVKDHDPQVDGVTLKATVKPTYGADIEVTSALLSLPASTPAIRAQAELDKLTLGVTTFTPLGVDTAIDFKLPKTVGSYNLVWSVTDALKDVMTIEGVDNSIKLKYLAEAIVGENLTAKIMNAEGVAELATKNFDITIKANEEHFLDGVKAQELKNKPAYVAGSMTSITLPASASFEGQLINITWTSDKEAFIKADGTIVKLPDLDKKEVVTLLATYTLGSKTTTNSYEYELTNADQVATDAVWGGLNLPVTESVLTDEQLKLKAPGVITEGLEPNLEYVLTTGDAANFNIATGLVTRPAFGSLPVTLTITVNLYLDTLKTKVSTKVMTYTVNAVEGTIGNLGTIAGVADGALLTASTVDKSVTFAGTMAYDVTPEHKGNFAKVTLTKAADLGEITNLKLFIDGTETSFVDDSLNSGIMTIEFKFLALDEVHEIKATWGKATLFYKDIFTVNFPTDGTTNALAPNPNADQETLDNIGKTLFASLPSTVTEDGVTLTLPTAAGANITWSSSDETTISNSGVVTRSDVEKQVTLTAHVVVGLLSQDFTHVIIVTAKAAVVEPIVYDFNLATNATGGVLAPTTSLKAFKVGDASFEGTVAAFGTSASLNATWAGALFGTSTKFIKLGKNAGSYITLKTPVSSVSQVTIDYSMWDVGTTLTIQTSTDDGVTWGNDVSVDTVTKQKKETTTLTLPVAVNNAFVRLKINDGKRAIIAMITIIQ